MARPLRIEFAGGPYHVTSHGDRREDIFSGEEDRAAWLDLFRVVCERFNWVCHAYCLMTNHYHLLVGTVDGNLSKGMRQLNGVYTQHVNRTLRRVGACVPGALQGHRGRKGCLPAGAGPLRCAEPRAGRDGRAA